MKDKSRIFAVSAWDAVPAALALLQFLLIVAFACLWWHMTWPERIIGLVVYAFSVGWNLNSVAHNFIHNPFFTASWANRMVAYLISWSLITPQTMYHYVHLWHHAGNADYPDEDGHTVDPLSIYQFGADRKPEPLWSYVFLQFFRDDDPFALAARIRSRRPADARRAMNEFWSMLAVWSVFLVVAWPFAILGIIASYLGQCLSNLSGYYEHLGGNPDEPIAWGVSTYAPVYNFVFLNNGYHAEHHYRPKQHWTRMKTLRRSIAAEQADKGVFIIRTAHILGFLEPRTWGFPVAARPKPKRK
ncbi:fatty acid desaturase family protein [Asticcacaulis solisilvae]|uniref:fatty acid desaturase family protein n=1 Tax=Asticcacaulis solisilvae TaxID=1217274 RepID=UPI003FD89B41